MSADAQPISLDFPNVLPAPVEMLAIARGMRGGEGPPGPPGEPGNAVDIPDLALLFDNVMAG